MASRSVWKGTLNFGMVVMPVKIFNGTTSSRAKETAMVNLHASCGTRLQQPKWCPKDEVFVTSEEIAKGYEIGKEQYIRLTEQDLSTLPLPSTSAIQVEQFVRGNFQDPRWFKDSYFLTPDKVGNKAFILFLKAMAAEGVSGISKVAFRANSRETLCLVRPFGDLLMLQSLYWPEELKATDEFRVAGEVSEKELNMASTLVRAMTEELDLTKYQDEYTKAFKRLIEAKLEGTEIEAPAIKKETFDILDALEKSLAAVGAR